MKKILVLLSFIAFFFSCTKESYTPEKIQTLIDAGAIKMEKSGYGGFSDYYYKWEGLLLTPDAAEAITKLGWELVYPQRK